MVDANEGNSFDSLTCGPVVLPEDFLPSSLIPPAHKPDFIGLLEPIFIGYTKARRCYRLKISRLESGDNALTITYPIYHTTDLRRKYTPLNNSLRHH
jgi:hypothetical protein